CARDSLTYCSRGVCYGFDYW
nr:immunoglobulin heavy chain junction region [Macaca mulatta]MOV87362.1 immunoglobulin heavy chain junction region [Macaca mulatta]MOV87477.1 immunoglobulin heavy chain junction region [Macaca mulatta]MOV88078.1 immunoglobulin heavy chain junction region [Macaca mulatta]MOV88176.1 immunoglobulin heavy chain junction region [Macaca mulatta]